MLKGFRDFLMRGNVVELAAAVIIGVAFNGVVDGLIKGIIDPLIAVLAPGDVKELENALALRAVQDRPRPLGARQLRPEGRGRLLLHRPALRRASRRGSPPRRPPPPAGRAAAHRDPRPAEGQEVESPPDGPGRRPAARPGGAPCSLRRRLAAALVLLLAPGRRPAAATRPPARRAAARPRRRPAPPAGRSSSRTSSTRPGALDPAKWGYEIGYIRNDEKQYYTSRSENVRAEGGNAGDRGAARRPTRATPTPRPASTRAAASSSCTGASRSGRSCRPATAPGRPSGCSATNIDAGRAGRPAARSTSWRTSASTRSRIHGSVHTAAYNHAIGTAEDGERHRREPVGGLPRLRDGVVRRPHRRLRGRPEVLHASATRAPARARGPSTSRSTCSSTSRSAARGAARRASTTRSSRTATSSTTCRIYKQG